MARPVAPGHDGTGRSRSRMFRRVGVTPHATAPFSLVNGDARPLGEPTRRPGDRARLAPSPAKRLTRHPAAARPAAIPVHRLSRDSRRICSGATPASTRHASHAIGAAATHSPGPGCPTVSRARRIMTTSGELSSTAASPATTSTTRGARPGGARPGQFVGVATGTTQRRGGRRHRGRPCPGIRRLRTNVSRPDEVDQRPDVILR